MASVSSRATSRSSARCITPHSKFLTTKPTPAPNTFASKFVSSQCVQGHWYYPVEDDFDEQELTEQEVMLESEWMKNVCRAVVAAAAPPSPEQEFIVGIAPAARDALDKYEQGDPNAFLHFVTMFPTIASFPQLIPANSDDTALPAEVAAVLEEVEREEYVIVDVPAVGEETAKRYVIHPVRAPRTPRAHSTTNSLPLQRPPPPAPLRL